MKISIFNILNVFLVGLLCSCGSHTVIKPETLVVVKDVKIPRTEKFIARFATHTYIDYRENLQSPWYRVEVYNPKSGVVCEKISLEEAQSKVRFHERVRVLAQFDGSANPDIVRDIQAFSESYNDRIYCSYPGPNSNTFIENMMRKVDGIDAILDHNAIGKEHGYYAGKSAGGTGLELQTPIIGMAIGLKEGIEVSAFGLSTGVCNAPPSIRIPFLPKLPTWE